MSKKPKTFKPNKTLAGMIQAMKEEPKTTDPTKYAPFNFEIKPETVEQKPPGVNDVSRMMLMQAYQEDALQKEAEASVRLDGDTQSCETCILGKEYRKQIQKELIEEIEKNWGWLVGKWQDPDSIMTIRYAWWQDLKKRVGVK